MLIYVNLLVQILANRPKIRSNVYCRLVRKPFILDEVHDGCENNELLSGLTSNKNGPDGISWEDMEISHSVEKEIFSLANQPVQ